MLTVNSDKYNTQRRKYVTAFLNICAMRPRKDRVMPSRQRLPMPVWTSLIPSQGKTRRSDGWLVSRSCRESGAERNVKITKGNIHYNLSSKAAKYTMSHIMLTQILIDCFIKRTVLDLGKGDLSRSFRDAPQWFEAFTSSASIKQVTEQSRIVLTCSDAQNVMT